MSQSLDLKAFVIMILRRGSYKWYARTEALRAARISRGIYRCAHCKLEFKKKEIQL